MKHPTEFWYNNVAGTANLLKRMELSNTNKIVFSSSAAVYDSRTGDKLTEQTPVTNNNSVYGNTKLACEQMIKDSGMKYGIFRYFNLAGADPDGEMGENHKPETHLIPNILENLNNVIVYGDDYNTKDGTCVRDYVHVSDVADAHVTAASYIDNESFILNLGNGIGYSIKQIIDYISLCGVDVKFTIGERRSGDPDILIADSSLAKQKQIFNPKHDIESIINTAFYWHICKREEEVI
jgi:UDP-glucose 4-epimerase